MPSLELAAGTVRAVVAPERGGMLIGLEVAGRALFYLDAATLADPKQNVRGGAPVLFPSPGKLAGDQWKRGGRGGALKQHGFARNLPWRVVSQPNGSQLTLRLESSEETLAAYPFGFAVELEYSLLARGVRIDARVESRSDAPMPFGFGFHPYFAVPNGDKARAGIPTRATRAFDNTTKREIPLTPEALDLTRAEVDLHLVDHGRSSAELLLPDGARVSLVGSEEYRRWVIWTLAGKDFVCLEPWTCPGDALNTGRDLIELAPGAKRELRLEISLSG